MAVPHARRALDALIREQGAEVAGTPLGLALAARVAQDGATEVRAVPFGDPDGVMIRGAHGRFTGAAFRSVYRKGERR